MSGGGEGISLGGIWGMGTPGSGKRRCKGPEAGNMLRAFEALGVAGTGGTGRRVGGDGGHRRPSGGDRSERPFYGKDFSFYAERNGNHGEF